MGSGNKSVTVGYRYYMGLHFGLCHGPVDEFQEVRVGERTAWSGIQASSGPVAITASELFGGDKREGGVLGILDIAMGEPTQGQNDYLVAQIGAGIPAFRGIMSAIWRGGLITSNNPYVKPWAFRVKRITSGWTGGSAWQPDIAPVEFVAPSGSDATVRLLTRFAGGSSADISQYALGAPAIINPTGVLVVDGYARFGVTAGPGAGESAGIQWASSSLSTTGTVNPETTWEFIFSVSADPYLSTDPKTIAFIDSGHVVGASGRVIEIGVYGGYGYLPPTSRHQLWVGMDGIAPIYVSPSSHLVEDGVATFHVAIQRRADGNVQVYASGIRVLDWTEAFDPDGSVGTGSVTLCNYVYNPAWDIKCLATRVASRLVYSGSSYSVPTPEELTADFEVVTSGIYGMNPAHIIYQCLTDTAWGMGYPTSAIDETSFYAAASTLYSENFGLSLLWNKQESIENFIGIVLDHIGGILYAAPDTGKFALKLIRDDYVRDTLDQYGPDNLISAEDYQRQAWGETVNEITVVYTDSATGKETSVTIQDPANILMQGGVVSQTRNYPGIPWSPLAQRVAQRDLNAASTPLARIKLTSTRAAWRVFPGDVFRLSWPEYGIDDVVYRALNVNRGTLTDGRIIIDAVEDVFGLPGNTYLVDQPSEWEDPSNEPAVAPYRKLLEAPYWDLVRNLSAADMAYVDASAGYLETLAVRPSGDAINYAIAARTGSADYTERGNGDFCPSATIVGALTKTTTSIVVENGVDLDIVTVGGYAVVDDEYVLVSALNTTTGAATISRGLLDTVPVAHSTGARIWFSDGWQGFDQTEAVDGEEVDVKLLPRTGQGELAIADATADSIIFDQRQNRPYPPGNVLFDSLEWPATIEGSTDVVLTWAHRDRTAQTAYLVEQDEASIGPETSVTYSVQVTDEDLTELHLSTGITAATKTIPATDLVAGYLRFRLWSVRSGVTSWQVHEHWAVWGDIRVTESGEARITEDGEYRETD